MKSTRINGSIATLIVLGFRFSTVMGDTRVTGGFQAQTKLAQVQGENIPIARIARPQSSAGKSKLTMTKGSRLALCGG